MRRFLAQALSVPSPHEQRALIAFFELTSANLRVPKAAGLESTQSGHYLLIRYNNPIRRKLVHSPPPNTRWSTSVRSIASLA